MRNRSLILRRRPATPQLQASHMCLHCLAALGEELRRNKSRRRARERMHAPTGRAPVATSAPARSTGVPLISRPELQWCPEESEFATNTPRTHSELFQNFAFVLPSKKTIAVDRLNTFPPSNSLLATLLFRTADSLEVASERWPGPRVGRTQSPQTLAECSVRAGGSQQC